MGWDGEYCMAGRHAYLKIIKQAGGRWSASCFASQASVKLSSCLKFTQSIKYLPIGVYRSRLIWSWVFFVGPFVWYIYFFALHVSSNFYCSKFLEPKKGRRRLQFAWEYSKRSFWEFLFIWFYCFWPPDIDGMIMMMFICVDNNVWRAAVSELVWILVWSRVPVWRLIFPLGLLSRL